jgi:AcrR family transcriptional regulator
MAKGSPTPTRRPRHHPSETEGEILRAAEELLRERPLREITIAQVMLRTGLKRPAFYAHFRDRNDLILRVVQHLEGELFVMADRWLEGDDPEQDIRAALEGVTEIYLTHGPVLAALADAAAADERVEAAYRSMVGAFIDATAEHVSSEQAAGRIAGELDPEQTARALVLLNERYLLEVFGREERVDPSRVIGVLSHVWLATLYGERGWDRPRGPAQTPPEPADGREENR